MSILYFNIDGGGDFELSYLKEIANDCDDEHTNCVPDHFTVYA